MSQRSRGKGGWERVNGRREEGRERNGNKIK